MDIEYAIYLQGSDVRRPVVLGVVSASNPSNALRGLGLKPHGLGEADGPEGLIVAVPACDPRHDRGQLLDDTVVETSEYP